MNTISPKPKNTEKDKRSGKSLLIKLAKFKSGEAVYSPYDLTSPDIVFRRRMPTLDIIYERFIRMFRNPLTNKLNQITSVSIITTDLMRFGEFINTLPIPTLTYVLKSKTLGGRFLMCFESKITYGLIDALAGGVGLAYPRVLGKEFTSIELELMTIVSSVMVDTLNQAWFEVHDLQAEIIKTEVNPQFLGIVPPAEPVVATIFEVELEVASGTLTLVIPRSLLESIKDKLNSRFRKETLQSNEAQKGSLREILSSTNHELVAHLRLEPLLVTQLRALKVDDVLLADSASLRNIPISINQTVIATGELLTDDRPYKIRVTQKTDKTR